MYVISLKPSITSNRHPEHNTINLPLHHTTKLPKLQIRYLTLYNPPDNNITILLLYIDEIILTASSGSLLQHIIRSLNAKFTMTDLNNLHYFFNIFVTNNNNNLYLSQQQYAQNILTCTNITEYKPATTPVNTKSKLSASFKPLITDPTIYQNLTDAL